MNMNTAKLRIYKPPQTITMAPLKPEHPTTAIHRDSGFSPETRIFHSLRPPISFPPSTTPCSLSDYVFTLLRHHRHHSLIDAATGHRIPISDLPRLVRTLASNLRRRFHLSKGDVVFIISPNSIHIPVLYLAVLSLGAVVCPSNPFSSASEIYSQIQISNPTVAFATAESVPKLPALRGGTVVIDSPDFESLLLPRSHDETVRVDVSQNDAAAILFSSGTTGRVKGVELTHRNFIFSIAGVRATSALRPSPAVTLCAVPFFHVYGFLLCIREVALGGTVVVVSRRSLESILGAVEGFGVTHLAAAPPTVVSIVKSAAAEKYDVSSLEVVVCAGAPLANSVIERFKQRFAKVSISQAYGLTETTGGVTRTVGPNESKVIGSNGRLASNCQAKIVDPLTVHSLPPLSPGELWIRGPLVMKGYMGDKEATAAIIDSDGWLRTGDICYFDSQGLLFVVDRIKELIKYKGYQVAPAELEDLLLSHPAIVDAAVIPFPDESAGQIPVAFVVRKPGSKVNDSEIMDFVAQQVAPYKKIRRVFFIDSIPKNAPGKVLRKELVELASGITSKL